MTTRSGRAFRDLLVAGMAARRGRNRFSTQMRARSFARSRNNPMRTIRTARMTRFGKSGIGVTTQHDQRRVYRKTNMSRFKKRRWKRFKNKVLAVSEKDLGSRSVVFNSSLTFSNNTTSPVINQLFGYVYLYPHEGAADNWGDDLDQLSGLENVNANPTIAAGGIVDSSTKWIFKSAILDITVRNASVLLVQQDQTLVETPSSLAKLEIDVYELSFSKVWTDGVATYNSLLGILNDNVTVTRAIGGAGNEILPTYRGATPFDFTYVQSRWGMKIWKKTKYVLGNGESFTYQVRDPKRRIITQREMDSGTGPNKPRWTRHILIIGKLVTGLPLGTAADTFIERINVGCTRKYFYKIEGQNEDRTRFIQN